MAELSISDRVVLTEAASYMMTLLLADDAWTEFAREGTGPGDDGSSLSEITDEMIELLELMGGVGQFIGGLPERMGDDLQARFDALMWGEVLSTADRDDLRWLVTRAGGVTGLAQSTAAALEDYPAEIAVLQEKVAGHQSGETAVGETAVGDLSKKFRCGLGSGLLITGAGAFQSAAGLGVTAAVAVGGTVAAGVLVGATGGVGAIALIITGIMVIRGARC